MATAAALTWESIDGIAVITFDLPGEGRIEATDTTRWFGFKDDVVIRVRPDGATDELAIRRRF